MDINSVVNHSNAISGRKPNKKDAFSALKSIINQVGDENEADLATLYAFFLPPVPAKPKTPEQWVARAMAKMDIRDYLNYLYNDGKKLIATDGHRMHFIKGHETKKGFYNTEMEPLDNDEGQCGKYPDADRVIPKLSKMDCLGPIDIKTLEKHESNDIKAFTYSVIKRGDEKVCVNSTYLSDAVSFMDNPVVYVSKDNINHSSILVVDKKKGLSSVIMPIRP